VEILIRYGADRVRIGRHGVTIFCVLCVKIECRAILGDAHQSIVSPPDGQRRRSVRLEKTDPASCVELILATMITAT
jgi:hypothetical protein